MSQLLIGMVLAALAAAAAYRLRALNAGGALASFLLGTLVFGAGGWAWAVILLAFFISSSALSRLAGRRKSSLEQEWEKGARRDAGQVLANGGAAGGFVLLHLAFPEASWPWLAYAAALAAVNADTWATELGVLAGGRPRLLTSLKLVERGTSGAVSLPGTLAALVGAAFIALPAVVVWPGSALLPLAEGANHPFSASIALAFFLLITLAGLLGSLVDSLLGATLQAMYRCPACARETERHPAHSCGTPTVLVRGLAWMNNDWVNILCALSASLLALAAYIII
jgi:uncharacterized protein (TIGR00297 family)